MERKPVDERGLVRIQFRTDIAAGVVGRVPEGDISIEHSLRGASGKLVSDLELVPRPGAPAHCEARLELVRRQAEIVLGVEVGADPIGAVDPNIGVEDDGGERRAHLQPVVQVGLRALGRERSGHEERRNGNAAAPRRCR